MRKRLGDRLHMATQPAGPSRIARWRPLLGLRSRARAAAIPHVLRLARPGLRLRTLLRSERHTVAHVLRTIVTRESGVRRAAGPGPAPVPGRAMPDTPPERPDLAAPRLVVVRPRSAPAPVRLRTHRLNTLLRTRVEHERSVERSTTRERIEHAAAPARPSPQPTRQRTRPSLVVRTLAPPAAMQPQRAAPTEASRQPESPVAIAAAPAPPPAHAPAVDLDELVERVLRRIERRAIAQQERLGKV